MKYVIIGNSAAGIGGAEGIRKYDLKGHITIISDEPYHSYSRPLISYYLAGKVNFDDLKYRPDNFYNRNNIDCKFGKKVLNIDTNNIEVRLKDGEKIKYDKLLIATGGKTIIPSIKGINKNNIYTFLNLNDARQIMKHMEGKKRGKAVILGAGLIGLKTAEALVEKGFKVYVVELADRILNSILDKKAAEIVKTYLEEKGIKFCLNDTVTEFTGDKKITGVKLKSGLTIGCSLGIIAIGVKPNISIIDDTEIVVNNGILVDPKMETSVDDIYAAGDVCESYDMLRGTRNLVPIWPGAYNQGFTAGQNMSGADTTYKTNFARNSISFFGLPMITAGIINISNNEKEKCEVYRKISSADRSYKKIVIKDQKVIGYILINTIDRAGILTGLIREKKDVSNIKDKILDNNFGFLAFSEEYRRKSLYSEGEIAYGCN